MRKAFELERKYRISAADMRPLLRRIYNLFGDDGDLVMQMDLFLPLDDECSNRRLRKEFRNGKTRFLYTRKVRIASPGKDAIRAEEEVALNKTQYLSMLEGVRARRLPSAEKVRREFHGCYGGFKVSICIDDVFAANKFIGRFVELETLVTGQRLLESGRETLALLARELGLKPRSIEKRGYRTMVMLLRKRTR